MSAIETFETELKKAVGGSRESGSFSSAQVLDAVESTLLGQKDYHRLFDAKLMRVRQSLEMSVTQPTSLKDIPAEHEVAFREAYTNAAREIGQLFLNDGQLADACDHMGRIA